MDSKSKLESKNPNKIQTAKIQDSKASKDSIKLESNSPKLKDSKVSKTSKDSMKLESSPKLDSKTSQKSNSKSKSPKIQKVKNTCDSKQSKKSKLKSFIRTIPISIALASALSSQAVANWNNDGRACQNGYNCTISGNLQLGNSSGNIQIIASGNTGTLSINQGVHVQKVWEGGLTGSQNGVFEIKGPTQGITNNGTVTSVGSWRNIVVLSGGSLGSIVNSSTGTLISRSNSALLLFGKVGSIENAGTIMRTGGSNADYLSLFAIEGQVGADLTFSNQSLTQSAVGARNIIWTQGGATTSLGEIVAKDSSRLEGNFDFNNRFTGESITFQDSANMAGNISLEGNARITNGVAIYDSGTIAGNISLAGSSAIANGITIGGNSASGSGNNATLTGNISLAGSSSISKILIDGSNSGGTNGTPKLDGDITMDGTSAIANGITITNGGTYAGRIHTKSQSDIDSITIASGGVVGSSNTNSTILSSSNSTIHNIDIQNGGTMYGNIEAHWAQGANAVNQKDGNIGDVSIAGRLQGDIVLQNKVFMNSLTMSDNGTITGNIRIGAIGSDDQFPTLGTITLRNNSGINAITLGGASAHATIDSLTLEGTSSIGTITNNSNGTISNIALNGTSTITNGITNNSGGNIGTIISNTNDGVNNTITNSGTIAKLDIRNVNSGSGNGGTINYIGSGIVTEEIRVEGGATLSIDGGTGTITLDSDIGSKLNLLADSIFDGNLRNAGSISTWNNVSNIDGSFINASGASVGDLTAGQISQNLLNEGNITNLTIDKTIGETLINDNGGVINSLVVQDGSVITNGITNDGNGIINTLTIQNNSTTNGITNNSNIGSLNLQNDTTYIGTGSITNALDIAGTKTLNASTNGINILFANGATGTINNAGIIDGSLTNTANSTIKTFNTGSITGSIANNATIQELNVTGNVTNGIINAGNITTLTNNQANTNITNNQNIGTLDINANTTYAGNGSITNALDIDGAQTQFTISDGAGNNGTLTLAENANTANSVKTITNDGTIIGNLINTLTTDWTFGVLQGNFTNNGELTALTDTTTGSITGNLTNESGGIINTLNTSKVGGSIANNGNLVNVIVDSNKTLTGNGSITNSLVVEKNNGGNGYTLTIGNNGAGNLNFNAANNGIINNAGTINGNITNVNNSTIADFTNSGSFNGTLTNNGNITNFINSGNFTGNITNIAGDTISNFNNLGNITGNINNSGTILDFNNAGNIDGTLTNANNANIGDFTNSGSIKEFNNEGLIAFFANNGIITTFSGNGTIYGVSNNKVINGNFENVATALKNTGTISGNVELVGKEGDCGSNSGTICKLSGLWNEGTIGGTFTNAANKTINSVINGSNSQTNINAVLNNGIANDGTINQILNYNNGTINNGITNNANANIESINNEGIINGGITNSSQIGMINNTGLITGNLANNTINSIITTINTGSITGSITNSGEITTLNVTGNVTNGIANDANIGTFIVNESVSYSGTGSITNALEVAKDKTLTATNGITLNANKGNVNNLGTIAGNLTLEGSSNTLSNAGTIAGNLSNVKDSTITSFIN
ncbi:beta strand repeat-containing protein, partial [Helicobacter pullorum]|uniref:beta strand repeat-containing protein n=1 Tax=Helicobacter pullorum TaxID=35818 RepID=UPI0013150BB7